MTALEVRTFCKEKALSYKKLGELIGMSETSINSTLTQDRLGKQFKASMLLVKRIDELENELKDFRTLKEILKK